MVPNIFYLLNPIVLYFALPILLVTFFNLGNTEQVIQETINHMYVNLCSVILDNEFVLNIDEIKKEHGQLM